MQLDKVLTQTYPLIQDALMYDGYRYNFDLNKGEKNNIVELEQIFNNSYNKYITSNCTSCSTADIKTITQASLRHFNPKVAFVGLLFINELQKDFCFADQQRRMGKTFATARKEFRDFFSTLPPRRNKTIKTLAENSIEQTTKYLATPASAEKLQQLATKVMVKRPS